MIADVFASISFSGVNPRDPAIVKMLGGGPVATSGARVDVKSSLGYSPVFRAVNLIGNAVAKCKPFIYERLATGDGEEGRDKRRAMEHPSWRPTVRCANSLMSAGAFRKTITINAIMEGNGIGYVVRNDDGSVAEYIPLLPDRTGMAVFDRRLNEDTAFPTDGNVMYWTVVGKNGDTSCQIQWLLPENIVHIRNTSYNGYWGLDVHSLMRETLGLGLAAREAGSRFYGQGMMSSGILYMPPGMKDETIQETFAKGIKEQAQGLSRSSRLLILEEGAKYEKMSIDPNVAQALETRQFSVREIANIIGCQSHKLGDTERLSYASLEQSNQEHLDDDIDPWLMWWEEALEEVALTEQQKADGSYFVECNRKALLRTDLAARTAYYTAGVNGGWLSANAILRTEGDDPIGPQGDIYRWPINMVPADQADMVAENMQKPDPTPDPADDKKSGEPKDEAAIELAELKSKECERFVSTMLKKATKASAVGGTAYIDFLGKIVAWAAEEPEYLKPVTNPMAHRLHYELSRYVDPPYVASELKDNVERAAPRIQQELLRDAATRLERAA